MDGSCSSRARDTLVEMYSVQHCRCIAGRKSSKPSGCGPMMRRRGGGRRRDGRVRHRSILIAILLQPFLCAVYLLPSFLNHSCAQCTYCYPSSTIPVRSVLIAILLQPFLCAVYLLPSFLNHSCVQCTYCHPSSTIPVRSVLIAILPQPFLCTVYLLHSFLNHSCAHRLQKCSCCV
jgi:hypothetical protein